jgi:TolA-binding protein
MLKVFHPRFFLLIFSIVWFAGAFGQPVLPSDLKKPKRYENKKLGAEKSAEKKFKGPRKFIQNTVTHYNWHFNANNKLNEVLERAKLAHRDDFSQLLPFYNYTLERTSGDKTELDSVIYKANTGILSHDLRNAWIDNLFMLIGKAYYFRNELDSAYLTFQYINYAFSPKEPDGYDIPIGSNANEGTNALSVSTKEKNNVVRRALSTPPSRNEAFIWQIRTYIAKNQMVEAASLIQTLKNDPNFPERLLTDLNEVQALWFYQEKAYDSSAFYLERSIPNAVDRIEASRWEYLTAQLYELAGKKEKAVEFYDRARKRTLDPVLEVYSILNSIRQNNTDSAAIKKNIEELQRMGRKDRYSKYRDIVYFTAAQIELERKNVPGAKAMLLKSAQASTDNLNPAQRTRSFLLLGDLSFQEGNYIDAKRFYDSINVNDPGITDGVAFDQRRQNLQRIVAEQEVIIRQDSLQKLAAMPEAERNTYLRKLVRQLRRKQGLKEEDPSNPGNSAVGMGDRNKPAVDLFSAGDKGDWYFNNPSLKSKGFTSFKQNWGNRPNVDNWRRSAAIEQGAVNPSQASPNPDLSDGADPEAATPNALTVEALLQNIPLTPEKMEVSEDSIANAMVNLGVIYVDQLEQYQAAIDILEKFTSKYSYSTRLGDALYYLHYAYLKTGQPEKAALAKKELDAKFAGTRYQQMLQNAETGDEKKRMDEVTDAYENVYIQFIEGNFEEALRQKKAHDSIYGAQYWTPQLLYIESVYYLQARRDDEARQVLTSITELFPDQPMAAKAKNILEVLGRRKEIEDYLTQLEIRREEDTTQIVSRLPQPGERIGTPLVQDSTTLQPVNLNNIDSNTTGRRTDTAVAAPKTDVQVNRPRTDTTSVAPGGYTFKPETPHAVVIMLNKVDPVYVTESRNAFNRYNSQSASTGSIQIDNDVLNDTVRLVVMTGFHNANAALEYINKTQPIASTQIVPWLPAGKYSFWVISLENLQTLKNLQNLGEYREFFRRYSP